MNTSEQIDAIAAALAEAQAELVNPEKTKTAKVRSDKGNYEYSYADLADTLEVVRKTFSPHNLSIIQVTQMEGDSMSLITRIMHSSGQWIEGVYPVCRLGAHQQMGSALTYARRYSLFAMVGIAGDDDTDGQGAADATGARRGHSGNGTRPQKAPPASQSTLGNGGEQSPADLVLFMLDTIERMDELQKLNDWSKRHAPAFKRLSSEQQQTVKDAADRKRSFLAQAPSDPPAADEPHDLVTGELPPTSDTFANYDGWVADIEQRLKAATDEGKAEIWNDEVLPRVADLFPPDRSRLERLAERAE